MMPDIKIMIAEGEENIRKILNVWFSQYGYLVETATTGRHALARMAGQCFDMVLIDLEMPDINGLELLGQIRIVQPDADVIMITAHGLVETMVKAMELGAVDYLLKPFDLAELLLVMGRVDANRALRRENKVLKEQLATQRESLLKTFVAKSKAMQKVVASIKEVGATQFPIVIHGADGVGKQMVARAVHHHSRQAAGPFVVVNCKTLPEPLMQKELFGYAAASSAGGAKHIKGRLEKADNGTLLLNEIQNLSARMQIALLRILKKKESLERLGKKSFTANFRLIATTRHNPSQLSQSSYFRQDFYASINHFLIHVPRLKDRKEDIALLADSFLARFSRENAKPIEGFTNGALKMLEHYDWPGNVRELRNVIQRAAVLAKDNMIGIKELNFLLEQTPIYGPGGLTLKEVELSHIKASLEAFNWNVSQTARQLGIDRSTLNRKIKTYQMQKRR